LAVSDVYRILLSFHVCVGALALLTFWGAALSRKGSRRHLRFGRGFAVCMAATAATAGVLCLLLLVDPLAARPPGPEIAPGERAGYLRTAREIGAGLLEVSLATGALLYFGLRALRRRRENTPRGLARDLIVACATTSAGLLMLTLGLDPRLPEFEGNGVFVGLLGALELRSLLHSGRPRSSWLVQHLVGMLGAGAIAHAAFATNVAGLFTGDLDTAFGWGGVTILVFGVAIGWTAWRWKRRLEGAAGGPRGFGGAVSAPTPGA
jgi:hypothetical protein